MAYIPTVWATGDVITAEKLNKAEEGIAANNPMIVEFTSSGIGPGSTISCNYNLADILSAIDEGASIQFFTTTTDRIELYLSRFSSEGQYILLVNVPLVQSDMIDQTAIRYDTTGISENSVIFSKN